MEVLSVQNQYQGQFGVIGSSKVKDWTSPLTPPPPSSSQLTTSNNITSDNVVYNQRNSNINRSNRSDSDVQGTENEEEQEQQQHIQQLYGEDAIGGGDFVDGGNWSAPQKSTDQQHYNHHYYQQEQQQHHFYYNNHHYGGTHHTNYHHHHQQQQQQQQHHTNNYHHYQHKDTQQQQKGQQYNQQQYTEQQQQHKIIQQKQQTQKSQQQQQQINTSKQAAIEATYNNNMFYYEPPVAATATAAITPTDGTPTSGSYFGSATTDVDIAAVNELAHRVQTELRDAKKRHLDCTEVSLPFDLMPRIAAEIIKASEREPCGVRGCSLYIDFECDPNNQRRIASFKVDDCTVSTFELYLTLKQDKSGWTSLLPQFLKNLTRSNTILISPDFTLTKNKLYSCD